MLVRVGFHVLGAEVAQNNLVELLLVVILADKQSEGCFEGDEVFNFDHSAGDEIGGAKEFRHKGIEGLRVDNPGRSLLDEPSLLYHENFV